jgi:uncharacterized membrane protein
MTDVLVVLTFVTALGCGLSAGALFAFSSFVMNALARLPWPQGIAAMNSINRVAVTPAFMTALFGTALGCGVVAVWALVDWRDASAPWQLTGSILYLAGTIGLTIGYHVPRNDALAGVEPTAPAAEAQWRRYLSDWTRWNHVRVVAGLAAAAALMQALRVG